MEKLEQLPIELPALEDITVMGIAPVGWLLLILGNIPVYVFLAWCWFGGLGNFLEAIEYSLIPNWVSALRGEFEDDWWASLKLLLWFLSCVACVYFEADFIRYMMSRGGS